MTLAFYELRADSETTYNPDAGVDSAGPGSRRRGYGIYNPDRQESGRCRILVRRSAPR
jgi:hypothetical protein